MTRNSPEVPADIIIEKKVNTEDTDLIQISILGIFNADAITNIENEFQDFYANLQGHEINWRDFILSFYTPIDNNHYEINFHTSCKFEQVGEMRARALEYIHELGGVMGDIQSSTLTSL